MPHQTKPHRSRSRYASKLSECTQSFITHISSHFFYQFPNWYLSTSVSCPNIDNLFFFSLQILFRSFSLPLSRSCWMSFPFPTSAYFQALDFTTKHILCVFMICFCIFSNALPNIICLVTTCSCRLRCCASHTHTIQPFSVAACCYCCLSSSHTWYYYYSRTSTFALHASHIVYTQCMPYYTLLILSHFLNFNSKNK